LVAHPPRRVVDREMCSGGDAVCGEFLEDDRGVDPAEPAAAELVSDIDPGEPQLRRSTQCLDRKLRAFVPARGVRQPLLSGKGPCRLGKGPLLFGQLKIHVTINGIEASRYSRGGS